MSDLTQQLDPEQMKANIEGQLAMYAEEATNLRAQRTEINARLKMIGIQETKFQRLLKAIEGRKRGPAQ